MRKNPDFLLRDVAGNHILVPVESAAETFSGMISLNETGKFLWDELDNPQTVQSLAQALIRRYGIDEARAREDVERFLQPIYPTGAILE